MMRMISLVSACFIGCLVAGEIPRVLSIGSSMPSFALSNIDGKPCKAEDFDEAKILCLIFTSNHCPDSVAAATRMEALHQDYKDKGVCIIAIGSNHPDSLRIDELAYSPYNDSFEEMKDFAKDHGWTFPYLYDGEKQELTSACGAQSTPHVFVFDAHRKLRYTGRMDDARRQKGPIESAIIRDVFDRLLEGKEPAEAVTRSFGCSTKWLFKKANVLQDQNDWESKPVTLDILNEELAKKIRKNESGNVRVIHFWSTTCGPCVAEFPELIDTYRRFQNRNVDFISISIDPFSDKDKVHDFLKSRHAALPNHTKASMLKEGRSSNNYLWEGANADKLAEAIYPEWTGAIPLTLIVSPKGEILSKYDSEIDVVQFRKDLLKALE